MWLYPMFDINPLLPISFLCFAFVAWQIHANGWVTSPALLAPLQWLVVCISYYSCQALLERISALSALVLVAGISAFTIGAIWGARLKTAFTFAKSIWIPRNFLEYSINALSLLGFMMMMAKALEILPMSGSMPVFGGTDSWYAQLRNILVAEPAAYGLTAYGLSFSFAGSAYLLLAYRRGGNFLNAALSVLIACGFVLLSTGRTFMLLLACILIACSLPRVRKRRLILMSMAPIGGLLLFVLVPMLGGRLSIDTLLPMIKIYILGPLAAFDWAINGGLPATGGGMTFRTPLALLSALGFDFQVIDLIQPWAPTKLAGNVYTVFTPYYRDFGILGVVFFLGLLGLLQGWVFRQAMNGQAVMIVANAVLFYALLMQFFQDQYFSLLSQWVQIVGWMMLFIWLRPLPDALPKEECGIGALRI